MPRRPNRCQCSDIATLYSITSSARASSVRRHGEAERLGGLEVDHQLVLGRRLHRQIGRLLALEDAIDVAGRAPVLVDRNQAHRRSGRRRRRRSDRSRPRAACAGPPARRSDRDERAANALAVTIRPPFGERAKAATARSISPASRTLTGLTSTPSDGATAWMTANWPIPAAMAGIPKDRHSRHARRDLLEQFQPFPAQCCIRTCMKPVALPPGRARLSTKPAPTGSATIANTIGTVRVACSNGPTVERAMGQDDVRRERDQFRRVSANVVGIGSRPSGCRSARCGRSVQPNCCQPLQERRDAGLQFRIVRGCGQEHADAPHRARPAARAPRAATPPPRHPEHREIPAASCPPPGSGDGIVSAQTSALIDAMGGAEDILSIVADVNRWSAPCRS